MRGITQLTRRAKRKMPAIPEPSSEARMARGTTRTGSPVSSAISAAASKPVSVHAPMSKDSAKPAEPGLPPV